MKTKMNHEDRIKNLKKRLFNRCHIKNDCILWNGVLNERGYGVISFYRMNAQLNRNLLTHRASWLIHYGSLPKQFVLHTCDIRNCINIDHLKEGTCQENTDDMMRKNRYKMPTHHKGSKNSMAILNEELVLKIKSSFKEGKGVAEVSRIYEQPFTRVYDIKREKTWKHLNV